MKSQFRTDLKCNLREDSDKIWVLEDPLEYWSETVGLVIVPAGFQTDFASVPRVPLFYGLWGDRAHREAVLHDYLYRIDSKPMLPFMVCNNVFLEAMKARSVPAWVRVPMYLGVCAGGYFSFHRRKVKDEL